MQRWSGLDRKQPTLRFWVTSHKKTRREKLFLFLAIIIYKRVNNRLGSCIWTSHLHWCFRIWIQVLSQTNAVTVSNACQVVQGRKRRRDGRRWQTDRPSGAGNSPKSRNCFMDKGEGQNFEKRSTCLGDAKTEPFFIRNWVNFIFAAYSPNFPSLRLPLNATHSCPLPPRASSTMQAAKASGAIKSLARRLNWKKKNVIGSGSHSAVLSYF